jgi:hypothetical protein
MIAAAAIKMAIPRYVRAYDSSDGNLKLLSQV